MLGRFMGCLGMLTLQALHGCVAAHVETDEDLADQSEALSPGDFGGPIKDGPALPVVPANCTAVAGALDNLRCTTYAGYEACRQSMGTGLFQRCEHIDDREGVAINAASSVAYSKVIAGGCKRISSGNYECRTDAALANCLAYMRGNSPLRACARDRNSLLEAGFRLTSLELADELPDCWASGPAWRCETQTGVARCQAFRRGGAAGITTCFFDPGGLELRPEDSGFKVKRETLTASELSVGGNMAATVKRYTGKTIVTDGSYFSLTPKYQALPAWPECTPCGAWSSPAACLPTCSRLDFVSDHRARYTPDGIFAISSMSEGDCTSGTASGPFVETYSSDGSVGLWMSEEESAYLQCKRAADRLGRTKWGHPARSTVVRVPTAMYVFSDPHITYTKTSTEFGESWRCSYVNDSQLVMRSRQLAIAVDLTCSE